MPRDNDIDPIHRLGKLIVLSLSLFGARVGQADDIVGAFLLLNFRHHPLGGLDGVFQNHTRHGGALVGINTHDAKDGDPHGYLVAGGPAGRAFQHGVVGDGVVRHSPRRRLGGWVVGVFGGLVVGLDDGGKITGHAVLL